MVECFVYTEKVGGSNPLLSKFMIINKKFADYLLKILPIFNYTLIKNELIVNIPLKKIIYIFFFFNKHTNTQYKVLTDMCGTDLLKKKKRFELVYHLLSIRYNNRLRIKILINETDLVNSITSVFTNANWYEREVWDMFGIFFINHPDLRRILTDYGFEGYPLRKDFPVTGFLEVYYDENKKRITYNNVQLAQKSKSLKFQKIW